MTMTAMLAVVGGGTGVGKLIRYRLRVLRELAGVLGVSAQFHMGADRLMKQMRVRGYCHGLQRHQDHQKSGYPGSDQNSRLLQNKR